ncbi:MAG: response regulator [Candidatus Synoicihabitans palmerolidicus]|nr:response regulator [Candidatus Synoicihabitans palmerolidicus]
MDEPTKPPFAPDLRGSQDTVLVVEDEETVRRLVGTILIDHGYRVLSCADGVEAIVKFNANVNDIGLVITDVDLPHLDGALLSNTLRTLNADLRIIAMSGFPSMADSKNNVNQIKKIANTFISKPFTASELLATVYQTLNSNEPAGP